MRRQNWKRIWRRCRLRSADKHGRESEGIKWDLLGLRWRHGVLGGWQEAEAGAVKSISVDKSGSVGSNLYFQLEIERWGREGKTAIAGWIPGERPARALAAHWDSLLGGERSAT